ncbi:MAG TPA: EAL domain-containing protein [Steroidobacteraceae bacterium]|jgi:diguanylate cyclase (GGDEF)-like protein|nr:EAL domain-containing protein [Steroidobacteraceae bacterium]
MNDPAECINGRILVIDDNPAIHQDFEKILAREPAVSTGMTMAEKILFGESDVAVTQPSFELHFAQQGEQGVKLAARAVADRKPFALAFIDMRMPPGWDGLETIERLWAVDADVQVVICSAHSDYDWADFIERLGHSDKLLVLKKPFEPIEVLQCASALTRKWHDSQVVRRQVQSLEHMVAVRTMGLEAANHQLRHLATHDALTGLPNRVLLDDRLEQAIVHAERDAHRFAVLVLDLDRFKFINDSLGHRAGDELLNKFAQRLQGIVKKIDTVARVGGDEFVLVLGTAAHRSDAEGVAQRAIDTLRAPIRISGVDLHISTSVGIAFYPTDGTSSENLIAHADAAMYCAKQRGRNNLQFFEPGMDTATRERVRLESDLHTALENQEFELYYQPKVDTATDYFHSAEALIRWRHPERGIVMPEDFIPLAEECGLINAIGEWVLREACRQCREWQREGFPPLRVAVNVSASQFRQGDLLAVIHRAVNDAGLDPRCLELELTESAVMTNPEESTGILQKLNTMGVMVSVDDFGTGYSSMSYLRRFPIDKLKIDRGFVKDLMTRADDASIVQAIISLAHSLRLKVVAEGVETPEQLHSLKSMGCDQYQGFHFSPPLTASDFGALMRRREQSEIAAAETTARQARL